MSVSMLLFMYIIYMLNARIKGLLFFILKMTYILFLTMVKCSVNNSKKINKEHAKTYLSHEGKVIKFNEWVR